MKTPSQVLQEARDEFEKKFKMVSECQELCYKEETDLGSNWKDLERTQLELKSFLTSTIQSFIEAEIELLGKKRKELWRFYHEAQLWKEQKEAVKFYDDQISHLKELLVT